jgi:hypothetical protein
MSWEKILKLERRRKQPVKMSGGHIGIQELRRLVSNEQSKPEREKEDDKRKLLLVVVPWSKDANTEPVLHAGVFTYGGAVSMFGENHIKTWMRKAEGLMGAQWLTDVEEDLSEVIKPLMENINGMVSVGG